MDSIRGTILFPLTHHSILLFQQKHVYIHFRLEILYFVLYDIRKAFTNSTFNDCLIFLFPYFPLNVE